MRGVLLQAYDQQGHADLQSIEHLFQIEDCGEDCACWADNEAARLQEQMEVAACEERAQDIRQLFTRPTWRLYSTPTKGLYICSSSTPPGGGVHGLCGYFAARRVLRSDLI